ncbi:rhodanese domain-containing protein CG4456-like [Maniola hyperantus]|uniref:rhodanese domain-containing protein CG4456-like n=1 Tax=Aphantopus hyperantus TaxID=2795564 RepID=UPI001569D38C|nr:thiosulfate sulfurtransferase/rhodanese-like domain-containing protein 3 [Maniola hyperantus]XP_034829959.1 thiosulfate sulfurtransferase/rhodanese-like domain-containing protein 3 [Maniola hyperantus]
MLRRVVNNNIALQIQFLRSAVQPALRCTRSISASAIHAVHVKNTHTVPQRLFSEKVKVDELTVDYNQVKSATTNEKILIVDVREPEEVKEHGKIPNSINIPLGNVSIALGTMSEIEFQNIYKRPKPTEDTEIIFYCMIGKRSGMAQQNAINLGFKNVKNYLGSWTDWASKLH